MRVKQWDAEPSRWSTSRQPASRIERAVAEPSSRSGSAVSVTIIVGGGATGRSRASRQVSTAVCGQTLQSASARSLAAAPGPTYASHDAASHDGAAMWQFAFAAYDADAARGSTKGETAKSDATVMPSRGAAAAVTIARFAPDEAPATCTAEKRSDAAARYRSAAAQSSAAAGCRCLRGWEACL